MKTAIKLGPKDNGQRMSLDEFDHAEAEGGYLYELSRGVITVTDVPGKNHVAMLIAIRRQLDAYAVQNPGVIEAILGGAECKILLDNLESERHPDISVYKTPISDDDQIWSTWVPELVVEIVSGGSERRDYVEKPEEYLQFGVQEYWVVDHKKQEFLIHRRFRGRWLTKTLKGNQKYKTRLLPGLELACKPVWDAAKRVRES